METTTHEQQITVLSSPRMKVALAFFAFILIGANDGALGVLLPNIRMHYRVDNATIGLFFLCSTVGYFIASFNNGLLLEKLGNRLFLMVGTGTFLIGVSLLSLMPPSPSCWVPVWCWAWD